jgi:hypothetical protein
MKNYNSVVQKPTGLLNKSNNRKNHEGKIKSTAKATKAHNGAFAAKILCPNVRLK